VVPRRRSFYGFGGRARGGPKAIQHTLPLLGLELNLRKTTVWGRAWCLRRPFWRPRHDYTWRRARGNNPIPMVLSFFTFMFVFKGNKLLFL